jgi:hypothetical protein
MCQQRSRISFVAEHPRNSAHRRWRRGMDNRQQEIVQWNTASTRVTCLAVFGPVET